MKRVAGLLLLSALLAIAAERLWWFHWQASYPLWLISTPPAAATDLMALRRLCGEPLEVSPSGDQEALVRCGDFWPFRSVWLTSRNFVEPSLPSTFDH